MPRNAAKWDNAPNGAMSARAPPTPRPGRRRDRQRFSAMAFNTLRRLRSDASVGRAFASLSGLVATGPLSQSTNAVQT
eukprot:8194668-Lingulodinium_polyedra.AAC.1